MYAHNPALDRIVAEVNRELSLIEGLGKEFLDYQRAYPISDRFLVRARASYLSDFYNGVEKVFRILAQELGTGVPKGDSWHKTLLMDMTLTIGRRPPVISSELATTLLPFLGFRHVVRQAYGFELDQKRIDGLAGNLIPAMERFIEEIRAFLEILQQE